MLDEKGDVLPALAQGRKGDGDDVDAIEEVLAKCSSLDRLAQVAIGCRDDAHFDLRLDIRSNFADQAILKDAQQLDLHRRRCLADLVEENRAAVGFMKQTAFLADRAGERAALVAEELRLEQVLRKRAAVDGDELPPPPGVVVNGPRDQLLARTRFAGDQHRGHRFGDALDDRKDLLHPRAAADDVGESEFLFQRGAQVEVLVLELFPLHRFADDDLQLFDVEGLGDVIECAGFQSVDRGLGRRVRGDHDDGHRWVLRLDLPQQLQSRTVGEHQVAEDQVGLLLLQHRAAIRKRRRGLDAPAVLFEHDAEEVAKRRLIIDDQ